eukprot:1183305-Prorocentrum_minimum.AAC.1
MPALADCAKATDEAYQCAKNDGRGWRCPKVVMDGKTLCEYHWYRLKNRRELIAEEKVSRRAATRGEREGSEWGTRGEREGNEKGARGEHMLKGWLHRPRSSEIPSSPPAPIIIKVVAGTVVQVAMNDGREPKARKEIGKRGKPLKDGMPALADCEKAPDASCQCVKNDGRGWRCS